MPAHDPFDVFALARQVVPGLQGRWRAAEAPTSPRFEGDAAQLVAALRALHPEAGRGYWSLRAYGLLLWQPLYAAVIGVQAGAGALQLQGLRLQVAGTSVASFSLPGHRPVTGELASCRDAVARQVLDLGDVMRVALGAVLPVHRKAARRRVADGVLAALLRWQAWSTGPGRPTDRAHATCTLAARAAAGRGAADLAQHLQDEAAAWLQALGCEGESGLLAFEAPPGVPRLALDRRLCCLDHRRRDGETCSTCPRLAKPQRLARLQAEHAADAQARGPLLSCWSADAQERGPLPSRQPAVARERVPFIPSRRSAA